MQAKKNEDSLESMAYSSSDLSDYDYDDIDDIDSIEKEIGLRPPGKRSKIPTGAWSKRGRIPTGAWGRRSALPPGAWGKRSSNLEGSAYHQRTAVTYEDVRRLAAFVLRDIKNQDELKAIEQFRKHALERRKLALINSLRKLKKTLDSKK